MNGLRGVRRMTCFSWYFSRNPSSSFVSRTKGNLIVTRKTHFHAVKMGNETSEEYSILQTALSSHESPTETAISFTQRTREAFITGHSSQPQLEDHFWRSWKSIIDLTIDTPHEHQSALIDIVRAIQSQNIADDEEGSEIEIWGEKVRVWRDMPMFGAQAREVWNRGMATTLVLADEDILIIVRSTW